MRRAMILVAALGLWAGCFKGTCLECGLGEGDPCDNSRLCPQGLICDTTKTPPICVVVPPDASPIDARLDAKP